jgi:hypothetical protein
MAPIDFHGYFKKPIDRPDIIVKLPVVDINLYKIDEHDTVAELTKGVVALVDTGSNVCAIDLALAQQFSLKVAERKQATMGDQVIEVNAYDVSWRLPGTEFLFSARVGGQQLRARGAAWSFVLGMDYLQLFSVQIVVANNLVLLHKD